MDQIFHFFNFEEFIEFLRHLQNMFSIQINGILSSSDTYSVHITDFFGLSKGFTYIQLEIISKVFIILFLLCLWGQGAKTNQKVIFQISAMYILYLAKMRERGRSFLKGARKGGTGWDYPKLHVAFHETKKVSPFVKFE